MSKRNLTENQQKFLDVLFEEAQGDLVKAKKLAGYSDNTPTRVIVDALQEEIVEATKKFITSGGTKAAWKMVNVLDNPTDLGNKELMIAAKDILDRAGVKPKEEKEDSAPNFVLILPEKRSVED